MIGGEGGEEGGEVYAGWSIVVGVFALDFPLPVVSWTAVRGVFGAQNTVK
jgi:hypothetical protein